MNGKDYIFHEGQEYELDPENDHVKSLVAHKLLVEVEPEIIKKPTKKTEI